jgi:hypothetical protein
LKERIAEAWGWFASVSVAGALAAPRREEGQETTVTQAGLWNDSFL